MLSHLSAVCLGIGPDRSYRLRELDLISSHSQVGSHPRSRCQIKIFKGSGQKARKDENAEEMRK
ncbi:MAG: hypothetical protein APR56_02045 [Methanosaeta sp. SDB]|nr:MAG: hypothetical protein APR56_02045 [Methanosaeta sp. SDB]